MFCVYSMLHIVCFDVPYPPDYGGAIDVFYKIKALSKAGVDLHLHCFCYGNRGESVQLEQFCQQVYYYPRLAAWQSVWQVEPYIAASRCHADLLHRLHDLPFPILFEGLHSCHYLAHPLLQNRLKWVRTHNVEHDYYAFLAKRETLLPKKMFFEIESRRLRHFEPVLAHANGLLPISPPDTAHFSRIHGQVHYLPAFHPNEQVILQTGTGDFALYHGNLGLSENHLAAVWLVEKVFAHLPFRLVIAGKSPRLELVSLVARHSNTRLVTNPDANELQALLTQAHLHVLPATQPTGIKLKLLHALFCGRFCLVNATMVQGTGLEALCTVVADNDANTFAKQVVRLFALPFDQQYAGIRQKVLSNNFSNAVNAQYLVEWLGLKK